MKPTPLLDFWHKPDKAGAPVAVLATTFALDPDFFERNCLARFLEVSSVSEDSGAVDDVVAAVEMQELLQRASVTVLADRSAPVQRSSLLWDLLGCRVSNGLLHAKVAVLLWEDATRVILGSANLTAAGYRRQIELALAVDLGPHCLFPKDVLSEIADELASYVPLVPGYDPGAAVFARVDRTLSLFRQRIASQPAVKTEVRVAFAPTNSAARPLERLGAVWSGTKPLSATHLSPFWDAGDRACLAEVRRHLTGQPAAARAQNVAVVLGPRGQVSFPAHLGEVVTCVRELKPSDLEVRTLHAKCLLMTSEHWVAALVGSSNHTKAGLGLVPQRHREMNVWLGAARRSKAGQALLALVPLGRPVAADAQQDEPSDEDELRLPSLPSGFGLCRLRRAPADGAWELLLDIRDAADMPADWAVGMPGHSPLFTRGQWSATGCAGSTVLEVRADTLPMCLAVQWSDGTAFWAIVADDRHALPPGPILANLRAHQLLDALASGRSLADVVRRMVQRDPPDGRDGRAGDKDGSLDPLRRLEVRHALLKRGRALAASLAAMQLRLEHPVITWDALQARLAGPLGPQFVAAKVVEDAEAGELALAEAIFTLAEIALCVGRVDWPRASRHVDRAQAMALVDATLTRLASLQARLGTQPSDMSSYARRAIEEARRCLAC